MSVAERAESVRIAADIASKCIKFTLDRNDRVERWDESLRAVTGPHSRFVVLLDAGRESKLRDARGHYIPRIDIRHRNEEVHVERSAQI